MRYRGASARFNPTICGNEPVGFGSAFGISGGSVALAVASGNRVLISRRNPSSVSTLAAIFAIGANSAVLASAGWLAVSNAARSSSPLISGAYFSRKRARPMASCASAYPTTRADHVALLHRVQRFEVAPAIGVIQFDLFGRLAPAPRRPVDVGAQPDRLAAGDIGDDIEREVMAADVALRARFQQQPLLTQFARKIGDAGGAKSRDGAIRLAVGEVDHGEARRDLGARRSLQPVIDLILQEFAGLIEQIDRHQPIGEPADHFVAAPPDRRQFAVFVEQPERIDRRKVVALRSEKELRKQRRRLVLALP